MRLLFKMNETLFIHKTIDTDIFTIQDVLNDNACFYRAVANSLLYGSPYKSVKYILSMKRWGNVKSIDNLQNTYGKYSDTQDLLAREIQKSILNYVKNNKNTTVDIMDGIQLKDAIEMIHNLTWEEYVNYYNTFAGDIQMDEFNNDGIFIDRWGGIIEQWIVSEVYRIPLIILNSQKWDSRYNKIINGKIINNKPNKGVRLKIISIIGKKYLKDTLPICLIWRMHNDNGHYLACYIKDKKNIKNMIINK